MAMKRILKFLTIVGFSCVLLGMLGWLITKSVLTIKAEEKANSIIALASEDNDFRSDEQKLVAIASQVSENFEQIDPALVPIYKLRSYITNDRLPDFIRLETGVMETLLQKGLCDNTSRMLSFILNQKGYQSVQWDMVTPGGGHAANLVTLPNGKNVYVDALFGVIAVDQNGDLTDAHEAHSRIKNGNNVEDVFQPLTEDSEHKFYYDFENVSMGSENEPLYIEATIPNFDDTLFLGEIDQNGQDVQRASAKHEMGTVWNYAGHRYNRNWVRVLKIKQPVRVKVTLVSEVEDGVITSEPKPSIDGKNMIWDLKADEELRLYDGRAKISLKRLNSFIDVDQIIFSHPQSHKEKSW